MVSKNNKALADSTRRPSSNDMLAFVAYLNHNKIEDVYGQLFRKHSTKGPGQIDVTLVPVHERELLKVARRLHNRYTRGEYVHTEAELGSILELGQILVKRHAEMNGFEVRSPALNPENMRAKTMPPVGTYEAAEKLVITGEW